MNIKWVDSDLNIRWIDSDLNIKLVDSDLNTKTILSATILILRLNHFCDENFFIFCIWVPYYITYSISTQK